MAVSLDRLDTVQSLESRVKVVRILARAQPTRKHKELNGFDIITTYRTSSIRFDLYGEKFEFSFGAGELTRVLEDLLIDNLTGPRSFVLKRRPKKEDWLKALDNTIIRMRAEKGRVIMRFSSIEDFEFSLNPFNIEQVALVDRKIPVFD